MAMCRSTVYVVILAMGIMAKPGIKEIFGLGAEEELKDFYYDNPSNISTLVFDQESNCNQDDGDKCEAYLSQCVALISVLNPPSSTYFQGITCYLGTHDNMEQKKINCTTEGCAKIVGN